MNQTTTMLDAAVSSPILPPHSTSSFFQDLDKLKVDVLAAGLDGAVTELTSTIEVKKPNKNDFVQIDPDATRTIPVVLAEIREQIAVQYNIVMPSMISEMTALGSAAYYQLYPAVNRDGVPFIWPVKIPTGGASNDWLTTGMAAAEAAKKHWVRVFADMGQGRYRIMKAEGELDAPEFSSKSLNEMLEIGFNGRVIDHSDHPVCRKLRGLA
jgi:hypothetical protein